MRILASPAASQVVPGVLGFLVVAAMAVALFFLLRSMNKQLHKVSADRTYFSQRPDSPERTGADAAPAPDPPGGSGRDS